MLWLSPLVPVLATLIAPMVGVNSMAQQASEIARLEGHTVAVDSLGYSIVDIAGEGIPLVGCVRVLGQGQGLGQGQSLILETQTQRLTLSGPLAVPRIAGPDYKIWVIGKVHNNKSIEVKRLGILATPQSAICPELQDTRKPEIDA